MIHKDPLGLNWRAGCAAIRAESVRQSRRESHRHARDSATLAVTMELPEFEATVRAVINDLPQWVLEAFDNLDVLVLDEPDADLDPDGDGLLGLYTGVPLPERSIDDVGQLPDVIYIFRLPHLALGLPPDELRMEIARTLIHEVAHYFGIDDEHLDEIGWG
jgi:predicted Zn-dependent protease with MMP-like domain